MDGVRVHVSSCKCAENSRVSLCSVGVASLRRAALQCEVAVCRLYECVLAQAVEGVLEAVQRADVWVAVEPTYDISTASTYIFTCRMTPNA